mmetsp:Transcript_10924/g.16371  ORF Transcript_10924/g.16371 Transcript_10924/m.16371 type:complete len:402 (-) Transcript_10924:167-1372(-)|eukprot:CAMPEP_0196814612 /NCGR_PEP_ID=MMETSP1362-20130617/44422_1 /TAXON_ID=163516 /ORGANISM="Leptocylindrus danicus, Strain CCMP1856" /LENGTH=401 /DNA_ID=CAMNT_0042191289 /DNA_START=247 /DNA_END=1452 /DNA_ORIENTATION=-
MSDLLRMDVAGNMDGYRAMSSEELTQSRKKTGKCTTCGRQCFKISRFGAFKTKKALNIVGLVSDGRCLRCDHRPEDVIIAKVTKAKPTQQRINGADAAASEAAPVASSTSQAEVELEQPAVTELSENWKRATNAVVVSNLVRRGASTVADEESGEDVEQKTQIESEVERLQISDQPPPPPSLPQPAQAGAVIHDNPMIQMLWDSESIELVIDLMNDTHEDAVMQKECCKVLAKRLNEQEGAMDAFIGQSATLYVIDAIEEHFTDVSLIVEAFNLMQKVCAQSDFIKDEYAGNDGVTLINRAFLTYCETNPEIVQSGCQLLATICSDEKRTSSVEECGVVSWCLRFLWSKPNSNSDPVTLAAEEAVADLLACFAKYSDAAKAEIDGYGLKTPQFSVRKMIGS